MTCQNFVCILRCQHFLVNIYLEIHPTQMSNHYKLSPSLLGGFPFLPLFMFDNHDKNHWFDQLQEVHWKGCSLRTSLPTGACGGLKLHSIHPGKLPNTQRIWTQKAPNRNGCGSPPFWDHMFFWLNPAPFPSIIVFFVCLFCKKKIHPTDGEHLFFPSCWAPFAGAHGADGRDDFAWPQRPVCCTPWGQHPGRGVSSSCHFVGHLVGRLWCCGGNQMKRQTLNPL